MTENELKYPDLSRLSRTERDALLIAALEALNNSIERVEKEIKEVLKKL